MTNSLSSLTPDRVLDAPESLGLRSDGRLLALNSYENRVPQVDIEDGAPLVAKFYRPARDYLLRMTSFRPTSMRPAAAWPSRRWTACAAASNARAKAYPATARRLPRGHMTSNYNSFESCHPTCLAFLW